MVSATGYHDEVYYGVVAPDPNSHEVKDQPGRECRARPKFEDLSRRIPGGRKTVWWPWWQYVETRYWGPEFAARLIIEAPSGGVESHPDLQDFARRIVQLAEAVEEALAE